MPTRRLRKLFVDRAIQKLRLLTEVGLASLVTAGVAACGGEQLGVLADSGAAADAGPDGSSFDDRVIVEAVFDGPVMEAAKDAPEDFQEIDEGLAGDGGDSGFDGGGDSGEAGGDGSVIVEAATDGGH
jgi:hypothetical protein